MSLQQKLYLREIGIPIPIKSIIEDTSFSNKDELIKEMEQQEQQQAQQAQQMQQLQMSQLQVENLTKTSYAEAQQALAAERMNKVQLDAALSAERLQRADEDRTGAFLNLVKAVKEIEGMDVEQLYKAVEMMKMTKEMEQPAETTTTKPGVQVA